MTDTSLNLFFGQTPNEEFLDDFLLLKGLKEKEIFDITDLVIKWYSEGVEDKEWEEWSKNFSEDEKEEKNSIIRVLLFIFKEFTTKNISESELREDCKNLNLNKKYVDYFIKKLKSAKEFSEKVLKQTRPTESIIKSVDWRIDWRVYNDGTEEKISVIEFRYSNRGKKERVQFDLNLKALKHLVSTLQKIEEKLCQQD